MDNALVKKYEEYKQVKESGFSNAERYRLLTKFVYTNPADGNEFLSLINRPSRLRYFRSQHY